MNTFIDLHMHLIIHLFIRLFTHSQVHSFVSNFCLISLFNLYIFLAVISFVYSDICLLFHPYTHSFMYLVFQGFLFLFFLSHFIYSISRMLTSPAPNLGNEVHHQSVLRNQKVVTKNDFKLNFLLN